MNKSFIFSKNARKCNHTYKFGKQLLLFMCFGREHRKATTLSSSETMSLLLLSLVWKSPTPNKKQKSRISYILREMTAHLDRHTEMVLERHLNLISF